MNRLAMRRPMPHNPNDIGWRTSIPNDGEHWFMTSHVAHVAISHCGQVFPTNLLTVVQGSKKCIACEMIEVMRDGLDGKNEKPQA